MRALEVQLLQTGQLCVDPPGHEIEHERPHGVVEENRPLAWMVLIKGLYAFGGAGLGWLPLPGGILVAIRGPSPPGFWFLCKAHPSAYIEICVGGCNAGDGQKGKQDVGLFFTGALTRQFHKAVTGGSLFVPGLLACH